jgi:nucleotide-binding universal stress UspA family protein
VKLPGWQRILVPVDFSTPSLKAVRYAVAFAERSGATIQLVNVVEPPFILGDPQNAALLLPGQEAIKDAQERLLNLAVEVARGAVPVVTQVRQGKPCQEIVALAEEMKADLIIIATRGYTGFKHVLLGGTAERVVRQAPCPVLTVRERECEFIQPNHQPGKENAYESQTHGQSRPGHHGIGTGR